VGVDLR